MLSKDLIEAALQRGRGLYKYTENRWALEMVNKGNFRIGTLFLYRNRERSANGIGDSGEGTKATYLQLTGDIDFGQPETVPEFFGLLGDAWNGHGKVTGTGRIIAMQEAANCYMFCMTYEVLGPRRSRAKRISPAYDACVRILDPARFLGALQHALSGAGKVTNRWTCGQCQYLANREQEYSKHADVPAPFIKPRKFIYQQEVRAVFEPRGEPSPYVDLTGCEAAEYCRLVSSDEW